MIELNFSHHNYHLLFQELAKQLKVAPENNALIIPKDIGEGIIKLIWLPNNLQVLMVNIFFNKDVLIKTGNTNEGDYVLNFNELEIADKKTTTGKIVNSFVRLTGKSFNHVETIKKRFSIQFVKILFSKSWLSNYIGLNENISRFEKYIPLKSEAATKEKLNEEYRQIINELWNPPADNFVQNIFYQNRILLLIEQFFTRMHAEMQHTQDKFKVTASEILKLKKVEAELNSFTALPPDIKKIAKKHSLSAIKLSQAFKQVYGTTVYNYYQKQRMQKAYELLSGKKLSAKQVSEKLGYTNFSNFILVFKKQFNTLPAGMAE